MHWTHSRQSIAKERLTQDARGWRVWSWYGHLGLVFLLGWGWAADTLGQGRGPPEKGLGLAFILFDANYEEFIGFPAPAVSPRAGVRASF